MGKLLEPEPDPTVRPRRAEQVPLVADIEVTFPYSGDDVCKKCGNPLSRYNPHILCFGCVDKVREEAWRTGSKRLLDLIDQRRHRNRSCPRVSKNVNVALLERAGTSGARTGRHMPQNGHQ